ncbi:MAG TPA: 16S rRNA (adenine(1518)-N(6)/adenine(1519)-N(6))-dimethyltransferase RsmA [Acidimicrobiia bacterium]|nr:16S rRNA (adenine(1518)-N(6)/adenine(1519)-N(6))-dimethyltransferase RsmA [Acidimicrobiia bacterium]
MKALTPTQLRDVLSEHGFRPTKALGQHFLADPNTARRIVDLAGITPGARVLEIGPGAGSLTVALAGAGAEVTALELDRHLLPVLADVLVRSGVEEQVTVVQADALTADFGAVLGGRPHALVANLPYNVAVPIIMRIFGGDAPIDRALVMVQREAADRLVAVPGTKDYGSVSVRLAYLATARRVGLVPPTVFLPPPKVDSALVELVRRAVPPVEVPARDLLFALVRQGFAQRRKMLRRALRSYLGDRTGEVLASAGIDPTARAESLDLGDWAALARAAGRERWTCRER